MILKKDYLIKIVTNFIKQLFNTEYSIIEYKYNIDRHFDSIKNNILVDNHKKLLIFTNKLPSYDIQYKAIIPKIDCPLECYYIALIYICRLINIGIVINEFNIYYIFITTLILAIKYHDDNHYDNSYYSDIIGISLYKINLMEHRLLLFINFNLYVTKQHYNLFLNYLQNKSSNNITYLLHYELDHIQNINSKINMSINHNYLKHKKGKHMFLTGLTNK